MQFGEGDIYWQSLFVIFNEKRPVLDEYPGHHIIPDRSVLSFRPSLVIVNVQFLSGLHVTQNELCIFGNVWAILYEDHYQK